MLGRESKDGFLPAMLDAGQGWAAQASAGQSQALASVCAVPFSTSPVAPAEATQAAGRRIIRSCKNEQRSQTVAPRQPRQTPLRAPLARELHVACSPARLRPGVRLPWDSATRWA